MHLIEARDTRGSTIYLCPILQDFPPKSPNFRRVTDLCKHSGVPSTSAAATRIYIKPMLPALSAASARFGNRVWN